MSLWPEVTYADIYAYFITKLSLYTHSQLKSYKTLDAYQFVVTWQNFDVMCKRIQITNDHNTGFQFVGKVWYSQSIFT